MDKWRNVGVVPLKIFANIADMELALNPDTSNYYRNKYDEYTITVISNKRYPFQLTINHDSTVLDIKNRIKNITNIDTNLQTIFYREYPEWHARYFKAARNNQKYTDFQWKPNIMAVYFNDYIDIKIVYFHKEMLFKTVATDTLVESVAKITENKIILTSLICKINDIKEKNLTIYGFTRDNIDKHLWIKTFNQFIPICVLQLIMYYYQNDKNIIDIFSTLKTNPIIKNSNNNISVILYKDKTKQWIEYNDLNDNDKFPINIFDQRHNETSTIKITKLSTIWDVKVAFCRNNKHYKSFINEDEIKNGNALELSGGRHFSQTRGRLLKIILMFNGSHISFSWMNDKKKLINFKIGPNMTIYMKYHRF